MPPKNETFNPPFSKKTNTRSTKINRDILRANAMTELLASGVSKVSLSAQIPIKFSQVLLTGFSFFTQDLKPHEQLMQGTQFTLSLAQTTLMTVLFVTGKEALLTFGLLARLLVLCEMLYQGVLIASWAPSELSKEKEVSPTTGEETLNITPVLKKE